MRDFQRVMRESGRKSGIRGILKQYEKHPIGLREYNLIPEIMEMAAVDRIVDLPEEKARIDQKLSDVEMNVYELGALQIAVANLQEKAWTEEFCDNLYFKSEDGKLNQKEEDLIYDTYIDLMHWVKLWSSSYYESLRYEQDLFRATHDSYSAMIWCITKISEKVRYIQLVDTNLYYQWISEFKQVLPTLYMVDYEYMMNELAELDRELKQFISIIRYE